MENFTFCVLQTEWSFLKNLKNVEGPAFYCEWLPDRKFL